MTPTNHTSEIGVASVGGLIGAGSIVHHLADASTWLASLSYIAAIIVAVVTIYYKIKNRGQ
jgi:hypothetical protein